VTVSRCRRNDGESKSLGGAAIGVGGSDTYAVLAIVSRCWRTRNGRRAIAIVGEREVTLAGSPLAARWGRVAVVATVEAQG